MIEPEPQFDNWKDAWEWSAGQSQKQLLELSEDELLKLIANDQDDDFYQIWGVIGQKGSIEKAPSVLIDFLERRADSCFDLTRYHCLEALFKILKIKDGNMKNDFHTRISQMSRQPSKKQLKEAIGDLREFIKKYLS